MHGATSCHPGPPLAGFAGRQTQELGGGRWKEVVGGRNREPAPSTQSQVAWSCWATDWNALAQAPIVLGRGFSLDI